MPCSSTIRIVGAEIRENKQKRIIVELVMAIYFIRLTPFYGRLLKRGLQIMAKRQS